MPPDVFITGVGIVAPSGCDQPDQTWNALLNGRRCISPLTGIDLNGASVPPAGQVPAFVPPPASEHTSRVGQFALAATQQALATAGLQPETLGNTKPHRVAVSIGTSKSISTPYNMNSLRSNNTTNRCVYSKFPITLCITINSDNPLYSAMPDAAARLVANHYAITGPVHTTVAACSTGTLAVIRGAQFIVDNQADLVLAGASDASLHPLWLAAFQQMGVLAPPHPELGPAWACRPFDRNRNGFVIGEGAAVLVLESGESMNRRGARPIARLAGWATGAAPAGLTSLPPDGSQLAHIIQLACDRANCRPKALACIHAHGTATASNDRVETQAITHVLGHQANRVPIVSIKGAIGHLLGAAGAVETAVAALACLHRNSPGTATLIEPDPELGNLTFPTEPFELNNGPILKTSLGFGGHLAAIILKQT